MKKAIPLELRQRIVESVLNYSETQASAARRFMVSRKTVANLIKQFKSTGNLSFNYRNCGRKSKLTETQMSQIQEQIIETPDITLQEIKDKFSLDTCISAISKIVKHKFGFNLKKSTLSKSAN
ncbi:MAG: IS630 transposase-related protein [Streptococcaceae bacterium]|nr:IS630 transposase-related protein [Streptococcaceae bacterium]